MNLKRVSLTTQQTASNLFIAPTVSWNVSVTCQLASTSVSLRLDSKGFRTSSDEPLDIMSAISTTTSTISLVSLLDKMKRFRHDGLYKLN